MSGIKNLKLAPKFVAVLHSLRLITDCWRSTKQLVESSFAIVTDLGTEAGIPSVPTVNANGLFPAWDESQIVDESAEQPQVVLPEDSLISFRGALSVAGLEHVLHNMENQICGKLRHYQKWIKAARELSKL